jgi:hypothetical protein
MLPAPDIKEFIMLRRSSLMVFASIALCTFGALPAFAWSAPTTIDNYGNSQDPTTSAVISPKGGTFVAWARLGTDDLFWSKQNATGWNRTQVAGQGTFVGCYDSSLFNTIGPSAAFTPDGAARIASACMAVGGGAKIMYSRLVKGVWKTQQIGYGPIGSGDSSAMSLALAMSPTGKPSIVFTDEGTNDVSRFRLVNGVWKRQQLVDVSCCGFGDHSMTDASFNPVTGLLGVAWTIRADTFTYLRYAEFNANGAAVGETQEIPIGEMNVFGRPSLAFLSNGDPAIAVQQDDGSVKSAAVARRDAGVWSLHTVDASAADVGLNPSLDLQGDVFHVAYPDDTNGDLRYATSADGITWTPVAVVSTGDVGDVPSLVVSATGGVTISYHDLGGTALRGVRGP